MPPGKRTYGDACGVARALDRVGDRWALMIVREMLLGPKRFTDLREGLSHLSADVLAQRLRELEEAGVVARRRLPPPAASQIYELTSWGMGLGDVVQALGRWGANAPPPPEGVGMSLDAHILSMRTLFDPRLAGDLEARIVLVLGEHRFGARVADGHVDIGRDEVPDPHATITTDPPTLIAVLHGHVPLDRALRTGDVRIEGDRDVAARFLDLFPLPAAVV